MDILQDITNITKAHAYDIVSQQVKELKTENERLKEIIEDLAIKLYNNEWVGNLSHKPQVDYTFDKLKEFKLNNKL